jgi:uncharacterized protein (TIGR02145 family)
MLGMKEEILFLSLNNKIDVVFQYLTNIIIMCKNKLGVLFLLSGYLIFNACSDDVEKEMKVSTGGVKNILANSADVSGQIIDMGTGINQHGHYYGTSENGTSSGLKTQLGIPSGLKEFTSQLTGLDAGTKYYFKAYLSDGKTEVYGKEISFSTLSASLPTLITSSIASITANSASSGGNISSDGGAPVTARGVCWSTSETPDTLNSKTTNGSGTGIFTSSLTGLAASTTYYVRAYATNSAGTAYGSERTFTTSAIGPVAPTVSTATITGITQSSATGGGNISSDGGAPVTARGVCWSTSETPDTLNSKTTDGPGTGSFVSSLTGLAANTTYYVRAYATNSAGTAYGNELVFSTYTISDIDGNGYSTVTIGSQVWMRENLRTTKYNNGTAITMVSDKDIWAGMITEAYCWYSNNEASYKEVYGALYNWYAVNTGILCPNGWHVPNLNDWITLQNFVGGDAYGGAKLKEAGTSHWKSPNVGATNETGFTGLPGGDRDHYGNFYDLQYEGRFWSSTEVSSYTAHYASLKYDDSSIYILHSYPDERHGNSVRCLKNP